MTKNLYKENGIYVHYCNWDQDDSVAKLNMKAHYLGRGVLDFNEVNHRFVKHINRNVEIDDLTLEKLIADLDSGKEESVMNLFIDDLNNIWDEFNDNPNHDFRSMCVSDVIEFVSDNYHIKFMVKPTGFGLIV